MSAQLAARFERIFERFLDALTPDEAASVAAELIGSGLTFDEAKRRLSRGRPYSRAVATGVTHTSHEMDGQRFYYTLDVPTGYDPSRSYPVRVHLHGGVTAREDNRQRAPDGIGALATGEDQIYILPDSWVDAPWWTGVQVANLRAILDATKRTYNVDENRVSVSGVSDGGTGAFYLAMRDPTPYASYVSLIGFLLALATRILGVRDELFPNNLINRAFFVVNGGLDPLYPTSMVDPVIRYLRNGGVDVENRPLPTAGHDLRWWPDLREAIEQFVRQHPRAPLPSTLSWQRGTDDPFLRAHWLIIDQLRPADDVAMLPDVNVIATPATLRFGVQIADTRVTRVLPDSAAAALEVRAGDEILMVNDETVAQSLDIVKALDRCCRAGGRVRLRVSRNGRSVELEGVADARTTFGPTVPLFPRRRPNGRVDLVKTGNTVRASTSGVAEYTLLLSPDAFDFAEPILVITNGKLSFSGRVEPSLATLLRWAAVDNDRTALFGVELHITVD